MTVDGKTKVFISWSGNLSKAVAAVFRDWLLEVFDSVQPWMSDKDLMAGTRSMEEIHNELRDSAAGIIITTPENQASAWVNYEAGVLAQEVEDSKARIIPILIGFDSVSDLEGPLTNLQAVTLDRNGMLKVLESLCEVLGLHRDRAAGRLKMYWPALEEQVNRVLGEDLLSSEPQKKRSVNDKVDEILALLRTDRNAERHTVPTAASLVTRLNNSFKEHELLANAELADKRHVKVTLFDPTKREAAEVVTWQILTRNVAYATFETVEPPF